MGCILFIFIISFILFIPPGDMNTQNQMVCPNKFQRIGRFCYHFSDETKDWKGAHKACKRMSDISSNLNVMLATLDVTGDPQDNQDLLSAIRDNNYKYWLGGKLKGEGDDARWRWVDNRPIHMTANYWRDNSPNNTSDHGCLAASTHSKDADSKKLHTRASMVDKDCSKNYRYVCQTACTEGFQLIGKYCYFFSSENKVKGVTWEDARKFCQGKSADLAVMGLDPSNDQKMLDIIANAGKKVYIGASDRNKDNSWFWLDGRPISLDSYFWDESAPQSSSTHDVLVAKVINSPSGEQKAVLEDATSTSDRQFVCQLLYTPPFGQMFVPVQQLQGQLVVQANGQLQQPLAVPATQSVTQLINQKGQLTQTQVPPGPQSAILTQGVIQPVYSHAQSIPAPGTGSIGIGLTPGDWQSDFASTGVEQVAASASTDGQVQSVSAVQPSQGAQAASTSSDNKVDDLLQALLDADKEKGENAVFVPKKVVKKEANEKDLDHTYDTSDSYDSYDAENTDFSSL